MHGTVWLGRQGRASPGTAGHGRARQAGLGKAWLDRSGTGLVRQARQSSTLISKPRILGFGLNLQVATRQVFSGLQDSYEEFYQCVKRSNRIGSTKPLNVHIPVTELEEPMVENVLQKAHRVEQDTREQEAVFREESILWN